MNDNSNTRSWTRDTTYVDDSFTLSTLGPNSTVKPAGTVSDPYPGCTLFAFMVEGPLTAFFALVCIAGNILTIATLTRTRRSPTSVLFVTLAVADMFVVVPTFLQRSIVQFCRFPLVPDGSPERCDSWRYRGPHAFIFCFISPLWHVGVFCSVWLTVVVTVNRYVAVCKPLHVVRLASLKVVYKQIGAVVICGILFCIPRWFEHELWYLNYGGPAIHYKTTKMYADRVYQLVYRNVLFFIIQGALPLCILVILTSFLLRALRRAHKRRSDLTAGLVQNQGQEKDPAMTFVLVVVVVVFVLCQIPHCLMHVFHMIWDDKSGTQCTEWLYYYRRIDILLLVINSSVNFFVFLFCSRQFRAKLWDMLFCRPAGRGVTSAASTKMSSLSHSRPGSEKSSSGTSNPRTNTSGRIPLTVKNGPSEKGKCPKEREVNGNQL